MSVSLYTVCVGTYLQILPQIAKLVARAEEHCAAQGIAAEAITGARLAEDMWDFAKQVFECGHHSARAIEGVRAGVFRPETDPAPHDFASLHRQVADSLALLEAVEPAEIEAMAGRDMRFEFGARRMDFTAEDFLLSFSLPNFHFHATTAFGILRSRGLPIGKGDYLGKLRLKA